MSRSWCTTSGQCRHERCEAIIAGRDIVFVAATSGDSADVVELWRRLWAKKAESGLWPVLLGEEVFSDGMLDDAGDDVLVVDDVDVHASLASFAIGDDLRLPGPGDAAGLQGRSIDEINLGNVYNEPVVALFDVEHGWQVQTILQLEDGGRFTAVEHAAILRYFEQTYGACLAATNSAICHLVLAEPVRDPVLARQAALERLGYADSTSGESEYEPDEVPAATMVDSVWSFWWD